MGLDTLPTQANGVSTGQRAQEVEEAGLHSEASVGGGRVLTLYHQTSYEAGQSILKTGFRLGKAGICGHGIYFCQSATMTDYKATGATGYIIVARVAMGKMLKLGPHCDRGMNLHRLRAKGYDSVTIDRGGIYER